MAKSVEKPDTHTTNSARLTDAPPNFGGKDGVVAQQAIPPNFEKMFQFPDAASMKEMRDKLCAAVGEIRAWQRDIERVAFDAATYASAFSPAALGLPDISSNWAAAQELMRESFQKLVPPTVKLDSFFQEIYPLAPEPGESLADLMRSSPPIISRLAKDLRVETEHNSTEGSSVRERIGFHDWNGAVKE